MNTHWTDDHIAAAVTQSMKENRVHPAFAPLVRRCVLDASDAWRVCCESDCDPCVKDFEPAVDRAREILGGA